MANPFLTRDRMESEVRKALAATLRLDEEKIDLDASIVNDLGATSIDFLDANFRLESTFGVQLATQLLLDHVEEEVGEGKAIDKEGRITAAATALLEAYLGRRPGLEAGIYAEEIPTFVTPGMLVKSVEVITDRLPATCTHCDKDAWKSDDGAKVVCDACGKPAEYPDGDALTKEWIHDFEKEHHLFAGA